MKNVYLIAICVLPIAEFGHAQSAISGGKKSDEPRFTMDFKEARWRDVIVWYSEQTGLPTGGRAITGTFSYSSPPGMKLTLREVTDAINEGLQEKRYVLVRRQTSFLVMYSDARLPDYLVAKVKPNELNDFDSHVPVEMRIELKYLKANDVAPLVKKELGSVGEVKLIPETNTLLVYNQVRTLRKVAKLIEENDVAPPVVFSEERRRRLLFPRLHARLLGRR